MSKTYIAIDGNEAAAHVAYRLNEIIAIYPITPSSPMGEWSDQWASEGKPNLWGTVPKVIEMQSEGGAAGAFHGALQAGALATSFTSSQGFLLMIPNMYKIAGELTPMVLHVAARTVAAHALSIFGDHSDIMAARSTGFAMLASNSVQEVMDNAWIAQAATLESRIPIVHFFDGFRTSHEVAKVERLDDEAMRALIDNETVHAHRARALSPDHPVIRGTAQNPDVFFQARETVNPFYRACPETVQSVMDRFARITGRSYHLFDYVGAPDAQRIVVIMGSGAEAVDETVEYLARRGEKVGALKVRLFRPFSVEHFIKALPGTVKAMAVLDRCKEPGAIGEPLYLDIVTALAESISAGIARLRNLPQIVGGRYGLSSKEFTPAMIAAIFDELQAPRPQNHFTIGINDDVTHTSLEFDPSFSTEDPGAVRALFYGLGADGTVGANKNSVKIIAEDTDNYAQGYFVYDSKKSGSVTVSHLRFGPRPIRSSYLISRANFVGCHQFVFMEQFDVLAAAEPNATFLLNSPHGPREVWRHLPVTAQQQIIDKKLRFYVIDAVKVAREAGMGGRINTIMQACFFALSGVLPREAAIQAIKNSIQKTYGRRGEAVVKKNFAAVDAALAHLHQVEVPATTTGAISMRPAVPPAAPEFVQRVSAKIIAGHGDDIPVSALPIDGTWPTATAQWEKRNIALEIPVLDEQLCIQCGKCVLVCPHSAIRAKVYHPGFNGPAPATFKSAPARWRDFTTLRYSLQVAPEDCTGCSLCVQICPAKSKTDPSHKALTMMAQEPLREPERLNWEYFLKIPPTNRELLSFSQVKDVQLLEPLFEFSGACSGCGETPYVKLMTQLFGDRTLIANATGCSSIYGGNLPTTPYTVNREGRGPSWSNSLFEDNAEFGLGMRLALDKQAEYARELVKKLSAEVGEALATELLTADQSTENGIDRQRGRVAALRDRLRLLQSAPARDLLAVADALVRKSVWIVGGDGWAYDIGFGGLDHVLASPYNINILVLDSEVYSNTGGQMSKATPRAAVAKFAAAGKRTPKKDLGLMAINYGTVYVACVALGGSDMQSVKAFLEAESYDGPSLIIGYGHCIAHGYDMISGLDQEKNAVLSGYWPLYRYDPRRIADGKNPFQLDARPPAIPLEKYIYNETRYSMLAQSDPDVARELLKQAQHDVDVRWKKYEELAGHSRA